MKVAAAHDVNGDRCSQEHRAAGNARQQARHVRLTRLLMVRIAAVNCGVGHVVEDLDGHGLGYECK